MTIQISVSGYTGAFAYLNSSQRFERVSRLAVAHAIATVGKAHWFHSVNGVAPLADSLSRGLRAYADLASTRQGLTLHPAFARRDMSEKGSASYQLGMGFTKIVMERVLKVPWLQHVDHLIQTGAAQLQAGTTRRGDLAGLDQSNRWHVVEAKGRSGAWNSGTARGGKAQASYVAALGGTAPATRSVSVVWLGDTPIYVELEDPPTPSPYTLALSKNSLVKTQLAPFVSAVRGRSVRVRVRKVDFDLLRIPIDVADTPIYVGVASEIMASWDRRSLVARAEEIARELGNSVDSSNDLDISVGGTILLTARGRKAVLPPVG